MKSVIKLLGDKTGDHHQIADIGIPLPCCNPGEPLAGTLGRDQFKVRHHCSQLGDQHAVGQQQLFTSQIREIPDRNTTARRHQHHRE